MPCAACRVQCAVLGPRQDLIKVRVRRDCRWWPSERLVDSLPTAGWRAATVAVAGVECFGRLLGLLGLPCGVSAIVGCVLDEMLRERNCTVCVPCVYRVSCLCSPSDAAARSAPLRAQSTQSTRILSGGWKRRAERALHIHACARDEQSQCSANHGKSLNASTGRHRQTQADTAKCPPLSVSNPRDTAIVVFRRVDMRSRPRLETPAAFLFSCSVSTGIK